MKIAISGGSGFIGTHLIDYLLAQHHEITQVMRTKKPSTGKVFCVTWDELNRDSQPVEKLDAWINLAGETISQRWTAAAKARITDSRIATIQHMAELIEKLHNKPGAVINGTAIGIYGTSETESFTEGSITQPNDFLSGLVGQWEMAARRIKDVRLVNVRTGLALGLDGGVLPRMVMPYKLGVGGKVGKGTQWVSWIHIEDLVRVFEFCAVNERISGAVNATSPRPQMMNQFGQAIAKVWHRPNFLPVPAFMLKLMFGEMSILVLEGQRVLPEVLTESGYTFHYPELETALGQLKAADNK